MTDEYQIDGTTHAEKDANGDIEHKPDVVNTGNNPTRQLRTQGPQRTVTVPGDYSTIQAAVDSAGLFNEQSLVINVDSGTYDEDVLLNNINTGHPDEGNSPGSMFLNGDTDNPSNVEVNSITMVGCNGYVSPIVQGFTTTGQTPYETSDAEVAIGGCNGVAVRTIRFRGTADFPACNIYQSRAEVRDLDFGSGRYSKALQVKQDSVVTATNCTGSATRAYDESDGSIISVKGPTTIDGFREVESGIIIDRTTRVAHGTNTPPDEMSLGSNISLDTVGQYERLTFDTDVRSKLGSVDTGTGTYTVAVEGDYKVRAHITFNSTNDNDRLEGRIDAGGDSTKSFVHSAGNGFVNLEVEKTFRGLSDGDTIEVYASDADSTAAVSSSFTYCEIEHVGDNVQDTI